MFALMMVEGNNNKFCGVFSTRENAIEMGHRINRQNPKDTETLEIPEGFFISPVVVDEFDNYTWQNVPKIINTKVVNIRYAIVNHTKLWADFRVYPDGRVLKWKVSDDNIDGWWSSCDECDPYYEEIKQSGLEALENDL